MKNLHLKNSKNQKYNLKGKKIMKKFKNNTKAKIDSCMVTITGLKDNEAVSEKEVLQYIKRSREKYANETIKIESLNLKFDGDEVEITTIFKEVPFERIRRITGYLVGTLDRFNNAKRAEVEDRVKHNLGENMDIDTLM